MDKIKVFVPTERITGEDKLILLDNPLDKQLVRRLITGVRVNFLNKLADKDYEIITNPKEIDDDTICLVFDFTVANGSKRLDAINNPIEDKIRKMAGDNYHFPKTMPIMEYFYKPFFPAVFKNTLRNGGTDKFRIDSKGQMEKIKKFFEISRMNAKYNYEWQFVVAQQLI